MDLCMESSGLADIVRSPSPDSPRFSYPCPFLFSSSSSYPWLIRSTAVLRHLPRRIPPVWAIPREKASVLPSCACREGWLRPTTDLVVPPVEVLFCWVHIVRGRHRTSSECFPVINHCNKLISINWSRIHISSLHSLIRYLYFWVSISDEHPQTSCNEVPFY